MLIEEIENYVIFPVSSRAEHIPSMSEHKQHLEWLENNKLDKFDSEFAYEKTELKRMNALININYKLHGDVKGIAVLKKEIANYNKEG
jgi:hypothetical protein